MRVRRSPAGRGLTAASPGAAGRRFGGLTGARARPALERIAALAEGAPDEEVCGLVVRRGTDLEVWPARNAAADPREAFEIAMPELLAALSRIDAEGLALVALYHSHPRGGPALSARDLDALAPGGVPLHPGAVLVVAALERGRVGRLRLHSWSRAGPISRDIPRAARRGN